MWEIILGAIIGVGLFFGGFYLGQNTVEKTIINDIDSTTTITTVQKSDQNNFQVQAQYTAIDTKGVVTNINIDLGKVSNFIKSFSTNTNFILTTTNKLKL